jgi:hypothetical protein
MRHFSPEQWADFVRKTLQPKDMREMQSHLESGCEQCRADLAAWSEIGDLAAQERSFGPPAAAVNMAKAAIKLHARPACRSIAELLFDSFSAPALAGVRSAATQSRQLLYGFDDYRVDLRFEPNLDRDQALLVGQILNSDKSSADLGKIAVTLQRGRQVLGMAETNEFGEFQLECDLGGRLELQLTLPGGEIAKVPLVEPAAHGESNAMQVFDRKRLTSIRRAKRKSTRK